MLSTILWTMILPLKDNIGDISTYPFLIPGILSKKVLSNSGIVKVELVNHTIGRTLVTNGIIAILGGTDSILHEYSISKHLIFGLKKTFKLPSTW